jgi:hypothetical protein
VQKIKEGLHIAVISDAGTLTISDPGFRIAGACKKNNITISTFGLSQMDLFSGDFQDTKKRYASKF